MNLAGKKLEDVKMISQQKAFQIKAKEAYLVLYGKASYHLLYKKPLEEKTIIRIYKWVKDGLEITEKDGKKTILKASISQELRDAPAAKVNKTAK